MAKYILGAMGYLTHSIRTTYRFRNSGGFVHVYPVQHEYKGKSDYDHVKLIGISLTEGVALKAIEFAKSLSVFKNHLDGFYCDFIEVNKRPWLEGFAGENVEWPPNGEL